MTDYEWLHMNLLFFLYQLQFVTLQLWQEVVGNYVLLDFSLYFHYFHVLLRYTPIS